MINWNKYLGQYPCYEVDSDFRSFNDVAGCLALIPKQIDTPALKEVRSFLEKYNRVPRYHGSNFEHNEAHISLKELLKGKDKTYGHSTTGDLLDDVKHRMVWGLQDSALNLLQACNQNIKWKKIQLNEYSYRDEWDDIINGVGEPLCQVSKEMLMEARDISDRLKAEKWDLPSMTYSIKDHVAQNWIKQNAWDLSLDELKSLDMDKELGLKDGETTT